MQKRHKIAAALGAAGLGIGAFRGGTASASIPDSNGTIHACRDGAGNLRVIDSASESCLTGETSVDWAASFNPTTYVVQDSGNPGGYRTEIEDCNSGDILLSAQMTGTVNGGDSPVPTYRYDAQSRPKGASWYVGYQASWSLICLDL